MKFQFIRNIAFIFIFVTLFLNSFACNSISHDEHKMSMDKIESTEKQTYKAIGIIKEFDAEKGTITINHEDIEGYMSAMKMTEPVADKNLLASVKVGDKVEFEMERNGSNIIITSIKNLME